ncbi:MAG: hypothetical protein AAF481_13550 [Acidobacteriota bacterium]
MTIFYRVIGFALAGLATMTISCRYGQNLGHNREQTLDPRSAFPDFVAATEERRSAPSAGRWAMDPCREEDSLDDRLALGPHFSAAMPREGSWDRAEVQQGTLLVGWQEGSLRPTSFVYAERIRAAAPGFEMQAFRKRLDTRLRRFSLDPTKPGLATTLADDETLSQKTEASVAENPETATVDAESPDATVQKTPPQDPPQSSEEEPKSIGGTSHAPRGFASERGSFSGWRWVGQCQPGPTDRGEPMDEPPPPPQTQLPLFRLGTLQGTWQPRPVDEPLPAMMIVAVANTPDHPDFGLHLAVVCAQNPTCAQGPQLARLLGSIRFRSADEGLTLDPSSRYLEDLAQEVGLDFTAANPLEG